MTGALEVAFVNNMPDAALAATNAQFSRLVRASGGDRDIIWRRYTLPGHSRSDAAQKYLARGYDDIETLYRRGADMLIVTGCEPRAPRLEEEPYWPHMRRLVDWARDHTLTTLWSCLAAHAAALHLAGVQRRRAPAKISGVYPVSRLDLDWAPGVRANFLVPHSRHNDLAREDLEAHGFRIGSGSADIGVDIFWREEPSLFVFLQGHPEYDADTLLKEYRRDVLRFLDGERRDYPRQPANFFGATTSANLEVLKTRILGGKEADPAGALKHVLAAEPCSASWAADAGQLFQSWLGVAWERSRARRQIA